MAAPTGGGRMDPLLEYIESTEAQLNSYVDHDGVRHIREDVTRTRYASTVKKLEAD